jgi:hypothetical protein
MAEIATAQLGRASFRAAIAAREVIGCCQFAGYVHADARTRRAGSHLCGRGHGAATAGPRQESRT